MKRVDFDGAGDDPDEDWYECDDCQGTGTIPEGTCPMCDGTGRLEGDEDDEG